MIVGFPRMQRLWPRVPSWVPQWMRLVQEAEAAAQAAGASLWYVPPQGWADRSVNGPFVGSDGSGGVPAVGSGPVGFLRDGAIGPVNTPNRINNSSFDNGTTGYAPGANAPLTVVAQFEGRTNVGRIVNNGTSGVTTGNFITGLTAGRTYLFSAWIYSPSTNTQVNAGAIYPSELLSARRAVTAEDVWQQVTGVFVAAGTSTTMNFNAATAAGVLSVGDIAYFDDVVVREIPGSHATQSTSANRPIHVAAPGAAAAAAGFGALGLDGSNDRLLFPQSVVDAIVASQQFTITTASVIPSLAARQTAFSGTLTGSQANLHGGVQPTGALFTGTFEGGAGAESVTGLVSAGVGHVATYQQGASVRGFRFNGASVATAVGGTPRTLATQAGFGLGGNPGSPEPFAGTVGLMFVAPAALSAAQMAPIERLGAFIVGANFAG